MRYFVAVAEEGSLKLAAEKRLHTAQPSLSRQIRALEDEVGAQLLQRSARGVELTEAGRIFLDHARLSLAQAEAAVEAARRIAQPAKPIFGVGFVTGHEVDCIPPTTALLLSDLPNLEVRIFSNFSVNLADDLEHGRLDAAFLRREPRPNLEYCPVISEPLVAILPARHVLAKRKVIEPQALVGETFIGVSSVAPVLRDTVQHYLRRSGIDIRPHLEIDNFSMAISLVETMQAIALLPASIADYIPPSIVWRPLAGAPAMIDLVLGFYRGNPSPVLAKFLSRLDDLRALVRERRPRRAAR
ncbi:LysR family transcriptional regulator [Acidisoma silvae]|uniref:LysR family transcriptional regulator n=1 Tax=Acidisoma silvae TaxID=2802396 RepID=UPI0022238E37|nr:LysR family transcriptional regulator [Acidisoma silvae]